MADRSIDITESASGPRPKAGPPQAAQRVQDELIENTKPAFAAFLREFELPKDGESAPARATSDAAAPDDADATDKIYIKRALQLHSNHTTLLIDFAHINYAAPQLADTIRQKYYKLYPALCDVVTQHMLEFVPNHQQHNRNESTATRPTFRPGFLNLPIQSTIRECRTNVIGELMAISGTVTRTSAVRPELSIGAFQCQDCKTMQGGVEQQFKYTEPSHCLNPACTNRARWSLDTKLSVFNDWQQVRIQENSNEIPPGSMPRAMKIILRHEEVEKAKPGDKCVFTGTLIVVPDVTQLVAGSTINHSRITKNTNNNARVDNANVGSGITGTKDLGARDLTYQLCFLASCVQQITSINGPSSLSQREPQYDTQGNVIEVESFTPAEQDRLNEMKAQSRLYTRMVSSIAPNIFGHDEIKRGILLMLLGGVHKKTSDGANLRGDINVCIVGDPSTSKSQFLKYVCNIKPRAVYTSGKASSAAGLTASVARDIETGEFAIEAGALMLADNSICCIDEFDKMDPADQVAIHEAMEQQTISIAKAGIQATLNARTSILAAANPIKGRYDPSRTLKQNVDISAPIMSRFDLFFVVLDEGDQAIDYNIARHIVNVHTGKAGGGSALTGQPEFSIEDLQLFIRKARTLRPRITKEAKEVFIKDYCELRGADSTGASKSAYRITVRQLESMVRLSEARARLDLSEEITASHVKEAARLLKKSIVRVETRDVDLYDMDDGNDQEFADALDKVEKKQESKEPEQRQQTDGENVDMTDGDKNGTAQPAAQQPTAPRQTLSFNEYQRLTLLLVRFLRANESTETPSMSWSDLVNRFIADGMYGEQASTEEELATQVRTLELVISRLITTDHILLLLKKSRDKTKRMLKVHPNFTGEQGVSVASGGHAQETEEEPVGEADEVLRAARRTQRQNGEDDEKMQTEEEEPQEEQKEEPATPIRRTASKTSSAAARTPSSGSSRRR